MEREPLPQYEVIALKYATREGRRPAHFVGGDPHDFPMPMDYYIWVIRDRNRLVLVDTGFNQDMAAKRHRTLLRSPADALRLINVSPESISHIVITHLHNDHVGTFDAFPAAHFHLQDAEMAFATGRHMRAEGFRRAYEPDHVAGMIRLVFRDRIVFYRGEAELAPGITLHHIGGHTAGLQIVRVHTPRGWVVLASDASHYYEHFERRRCFPLTFHLGEVLEGYRLLEELAESPQHIVPGHDPLVMERYPPVSEALRGIAASLHRHPVS